VGGTAAEDLNSRRCYKSEQKFNAIWSPRGALDTPSTRRVRHRLTLSGFAITGWLAAGIRRGFDGEV
jgi:hypothetical protein